MNKEEWEALRKATLDELSADLTARTAQDPDIQNRIARAAKYLNLNLRYAIVVFDADSEEGRELEQRAEAKFFSPLAAPLQADPQKLLESSETDNRSEAAGSESANGSAGRGSAAKEGVHDDAWVERMFEDADRSGVFGSLFRNPEPQGGTA